MTEFSAAWKSEGKLYTGGELKFMGLFVDFSDSVDFL